jgi:GT2 family glycosyltransferase
MDLSVIIINHNTKELTQAAAASLFRHTEGIVWEVIVVDNSTEERERFTHLPGKPVKLIHVENKGFAHGCNAGARVAVGRNLLFLNSDTLISDNLLPDCVQFLDDHQAVGVLGVKTLLADGRLDHSCKRGFPTPTNAFYHFTRFDRRHSNNPKYCGYHLLHLDPDKIQSVDAVSGAFIMTPRSVFEKLGGFDQTFFMYGEDLDYCFRVKKAGRKIVYYPKFSILHLKGRSSLNQQNTKITYHFFNAMRLFYRKHYRQKYSLGLSFLIYTTIWALYSMERIKK